MIFLIQFSAVLMIIRPLILASFIQRAFFKDLSIGELALMYTLSACFGPLSIFFHELGHGLSYLAMNREKECVLTLSGAGGLLSVSTYPKINGLFFVVLGGPLVNLALALPGCIGWDRLDSPILACVCAVWALTNITSFLGSMVPIKDTDGARLISLLRSGSL